MGAMSSVTTDGVCMPLIYGVTVLIQNCIAVYVAIHVGACAAVPRTARNGKGEGPRGSGGRAVGRDFGPGKQPVREPNGKRLALVPSPRRPKPSCDDSY
jgi:hypothetical protein